MRHYLLAILLTLLCCHNSWAAPHIKITHFNELNGFAQSTVTYAIQDRTGYIWLATWDGLDRYDGYRFKRFKARPGDNSPLKQNRINYIRETKSGKLFCKAGNGNVDSYYLFDKTTERFTPTHINKNEPKKAYHPTKADSSIVNSIGKYRNIKKQLLLKDRQGGIWVYSHRGLDRISIEKTPIQPTRYTPFAEEIICGMMLDRQQCTWIADKNGVVRIANKAGKTIGYLAPNGNLTPQMSVFGHNIYTLYEDSHGYIWLGSKPDGLFRLRKRIGGYAIEHFVHQPDNPQSLSNDEIYDITEDGKGRLWIGTFKGGLNIVEHPQAQQLRFANLSKGIRQYPHQATETRTMCRVGHIMLIGTNTGLVTCNANLPLHAMRFYLNQRNPADKASLCNNRIMRIACINGTQIYIATCGGGLCKVASSNLLTHHIRFDAMTTNNGMASDVCLTMGKDRHDKLWIAAEAWVMSYEPQTQKFTNYMGRTFGSDFVFTEAQPLCLPDGHVLVGTTQGIINMNPMLMGKSQFVPQLVFSCPSHVNLPPEEHNLNIEVAALDYNKNVEIQYFYRLEGIDTVWNSTSDNHINLYHLPAGNFKLHVKSTNGDGVPVNNERIIYIHRKAFFSETPTAWMLYGALLLIVVYGLLKLLGHIKKLEKEIKYLKLTGNEKLEYLNARLPEIWSDSNNTETIVSNSPAEPTDTDEFIKKIALSVQQNIDNEQFSVTDLATEMGVSRSVLYIKIKQALGITPNNYIQNCRIEKAAQMLKSGNDNVSNVAYSCGFADPKYFSRCFKKAKGCTPTEYQKQNKKEKNI